MAARDRTRRSFLEKVRPWYGHDDHIDGASDVPPSPPLTLADFPDTCEGVLSGG